MLALFKLIPVTLTSAGLGGFILSLGMAVDANILIFERMKDELRATERYIENLRSTGTLVKPSVKSVPGFSIYYLSKTGPYAHIDDYHAQLRSNFASLPPSARFLTMLPDPTYSPRAANLRIGVIRQPGLVLKPGAAVACLDIGEYSALSYVQTGSGALLSLFTQQLEDYCDAAGLTRDMKAPFMSIELYDPATVPGVIDDDLLRTELQLPLCVT